MIFMQRSFSSVRKLVKIGKVFPMRSVPDEITKPTFPQTTSDFDYVNNTPYILSSAEIQKLRDSCKITKEVLDFASEIVKPGLSTEEIDFKVI